MNRHRVAIILALCAAALSLTTFCHAQTFFDDFNRPDSANVGNGWSNTAGNTGNQNLRISNNTLTTPAPSPGGGAGIYRPFPFTAPLTVSATVTDASGYAGLRRRYGPTFAVLSDGTANSGYSLSVARSDQNYNNSNVSLTDNGVSLGTIYSPFQYGAQLDVQVTFSPDGSVVGRISEGANIFNFSFAKRTIQSSGANFACILCGSDANAAVVTYATLDNLSLVTTPCTPSIAAQPQDQFSCLSHSATFTLGATGNPPLSYQWYFNTNTVIVNATNATLTLTNLQGTNAGKYSVVVSNPCGSSTSAVARLTVYDAYTSVEVHSYFHSYMYAGLNIAGQPGATYVLKYTTDLRNTNWATWTPLATNTMGSSDWFHLDIESPFAPYRFYGAKLKP